MGEPLSPTTLNWAALNAKLAYACTHDTPTRPLRNEHMAVFLAKDSVKAFSTVMPRLEEDNTSLLRGSNVVLGDHAGRRAVLAFKHIPPATAAVTPARESKMEEVRFLAQQRAAEYVEKALKDQPAARKRLAVGVVTNVSGLEWLTPPPSPLRTLAQPLLEEPSGSSSGGSSNGGDIHSGSGSDSGGCTHKASRQRNGGAPGRAACWVLRWAAAAVVGAALLVGAASCSWGQGS